MMLMSKKLKPYDFRAWRLKKSLKWREAAALFEINIATYARWEKTCLGDANAVARIKERGPSGLT